MTIDRAVLEDWRSLSAKERWSRYGPSRVRKCIEDKGYTCLVSKELYAALSEYGVHITPISVEFSHHVDGRTYVGANLSEPAFLMIISELTFLLGGFLKIVGHFSNQSREQTAELAEAGARVEAAATEWVRITNYAERLRTS
jgi:hypothetical protein